MKEFLNFICSIKPKPVQSTRFSKGRCYTPDSVKDFKASIRLRARLAMENKEIPSKETPLMVELQHHYKINTNLSKAYREKNHMTYKISKGDVDNLSKGVIDAISSGICFLDDNQISKILSTKVWNKEESKIHIKIYKLEGKFDG